MHELVALKAAKLGRVGGSRWGWVLQKKYRAIKPTIPPPEGPPPLPEIPPSGRGGRESENSGVL